MMSERNNDRSGRFRNCFIGLRASKEEAALINHMAEVAGMTKQDYLSRALERTVVVEPSVKVEKALRKRLEALCGELAGIHDAGQMTQELQEELATVLSVCRRLGEDNQNENKDEPILRFARRSAASTGCTGKSTASTRTHDDSTAIAEEAV